MKDSKSPFHDDVILLRGLLYVFTTKNPLKFCLIVQLIKGRRSVTSHYHGSKIIFLESDGHFHRRAMKEKWKSKVLFLSAIMQRKVINVFFSLRYLHGNVLVMTSSPYSVFCYFQGKTKRILVVVVKWRHRANGLWIEVATNKLNSKAVFNTRAASMYSNYCPCQ